jgi:hypothetical protein
MGSAVIKLQILGEPRKKTDLNPVFHGILPLLGGSDGLRVLWWNLSMPPGERSYQTAEPHQSLETGFGERSLKTAGERGHKTTEPQEFDNSFGEP